MSGSLPLGRGPILIRRVHVLLSPGFRIVIVVGQGVFRCQFGEVSDQRKLEPVGVVVGESLLVEIHRPLFGFVAGLQADER